MRIADTLATCRQRHAFRDVDGLIRDATVTGSPYAISRGDWIAHFADSYALSYDSTGVSR